MFGWYYFSSCYKFIILFLYPKVFFYYLMGQITKRQNLIKFKITLSMIIDFFYFTCFKLLRFIRKCFKSGAGSVPEPSEKADPRLLKKADPIPKFIIRIKDSRLTNLWRCWFQIWRYIFQIPVKNYPNKAFPNVGIFIFSRNFIIR